MKAFNAGKQIKVLAIINFILIFLVGCIISYALSESASYYSYSYTSEINSTVLIAGILISFFVSYLSSIMLYAFGSIVDSTFQTARNTEKLLEEQKRANQLKKSEEE